MEKHSIEEKRIKLDNPKELFDLVKESPEYVSWKNLVESVGYGNTTLKSYRSGRNIFRGDVFLKLLDYLVREQKKKFLQEAVLLDKHWASKKGTKKIIEIGKDFGLSRIPTKKKEKLLQMIENKHSLNKVSKETGLLKTTVYYYSRKLNGRTYFEPEFDLKYSEIEGEIAGIFAGDGSQHHDSKRGSYRVNIHFGKTDYVFYVKDLFENYFNKKFRLNYESKGTRRLCTESKKIFFHFKNYLDYDSKIKHSTVSLKSLDFPEKFLIGFLRGLLDTDGTIAKCSDRPMRIVYTTTSKKLSKQVKELLKQFDICCGGYTAKRSGLKDLYQVYILARSNERFLQLVKPFKRKCLGL